MTGTLRIRYSSALLISLAVAVLPGFPAAMAAGGGPLDPQFSYQGRLNDPAGPATGLFDLRFDLYDAEAGGTQIGVSAFRPEVKVTGGFFTVDLDFGGPAAFNGEQRWIEIFVRPAGTGGAWTLLTPRQRTAPVPYALRALTANSVSPGSISAAQLAPGAVDGSRLAAGAVGAGALDTAGSPPLSGQVLSWDDTAGAFRWVNPPAAGAPAWLLGGNAGTTPGMDFIGTTDNTPLIFRAGNVRSLELRSTIRGYGFPILTGSEESVNVIAGHSGNSVIAGIVGATISGGGGSTWDFLFGTDSQPNAIQSDYATIGGGIRHTILNDSAGAIIGGGRNNTINSSAPGSVIPGGENNVVFFGASGALAAGTGAMAGHSGTFVWADRQPGQFASSEANQFAVRAENGLYLASPKGIMMSAGDTPMVTRGWDPFDAGAGVKAGHGRWGLFMEPFNLVCGIPESAGRGFEIAKYRTDGTRTTLFSVSQEGTVWSGRDASFRTITIRGGADLAEPFDTGDEVIEPGSVVVIDEAGTGRLEQSTRACDTRVAGVVSGANGIRPGLCLSQEGVNETGTKVALTGRVYCRCDASAAAIRPGDLLTTSNTPGHAMKAPRGERAQGAILGKAMSSLEKGTAGTVLILVTLQ